MKSAPLADNQESPKEEKSVVVNKSRVLGKGLSALIQGADLTGMTAAPDEDTSIHMVPLENIGFNPDQPRKLFNANRLEELAEIRAEAAGTDKQNILTDMAASVPLKRIGNPYNIANMVLFLASEKASYITGTTTQVDGGAIKSTF